MHIVTVAQCNTSLSIEGQTRTMKLTTTAVTVAVTLMHGYLSGLAMPAVRLRYSTNTSPQLVTSRTTSGMNVPSDAQSAW